MEFFADIADVAQIKEVQSWLPLDGVTTNPTIVAREKKELFKLVEELLAACRGLVHVQTLAHSTEEIVAEAKRLLAVDPKRIIPKIPVTQAGLGAVLRLSEEGIRTTVTGVVTVAQGLLAAKAGATYVAPYVNWVDNIEHSGAEVVAELLEAFAAFDLEAKVLAASVKNSRQFRDLVALGCHAVTMPPETYAMVLDHPLTERALEAFENNWMRTFAEYKLDSKLRGEG